MSNRSRSARTFVLAATLFLSDPQSRAMKDYDGLEAMAGEYREGRGMNYARRYPWLFKVDSTRWPKGRSGRLLLRKLNTVGRRTKRKIRIDSGLRTPHQQWHAYKDYLRGGTLAAPCCSKHFLHPWALCGRQCASNHCQSRAADCEIMSSDGEGFQSIGLDQDARRVMRRVGLCLPVGEHEVWHVEVGTTWRS
jgi:hypothetical protein